MTDDASDFFQFLTNSYLAEPTPENAQRLWRAVFALEGLYLLMRPIGGEAVPAIALHEGSAHILVWTDLASLRSYVLQSTEDDRSREPQYLLVKMPAVIDRLLQFEAHGVDGVRFNAPLGWSVPFARLRMVAGHFGILHS